MTHNNTPEDIADPETMFTTHGEALSTASATACLPTGRSPPGKGNSRRRCCCCCCPAAAAGCLSTAKRVIRFRIQRKKIRRTCGRTNQKVGGLVDCVCVCVDCPIMYTRSSR